MPNDPATQQSPAAKPAAVAKAGAGLGPRNAANTAAPIRASTNAVPSVFAGFAALAFSCEITVSRIQTRANSAGEYHTAPSTMLETPAASTAQRFIDSSIDGISFRRSLGKRSRDANAAGVRGSCKKVTGSTDDDREAVGAVRARELARAHAGELAELAIEVRLIVVPARQRDTRPVESPSLLHEVDGVAKAEHSRKRFRREPNVIVEQRAEVLPADTERAAQVLDSRRTMRFGQRADRD